MAKRGRPKKDRNYFCDTEEEALAQYILSDDAEEREMLFNYILHPALTKMIESIIRRYNLYVQDEEFDETFNDTISFLMTKINKFKVDSGFKAYSYCGTICKNYLIHKNNQYAKKINRNDRYEDVQHNLEDNMDYSYNMSNPEDDNFLTNIITNITKEIVDIVSKKDELELKENEVKVGMALIEILNNWEDLFARMGSNKFNKSSIYMFLKETTMLSTNDIRNGIKKYKTAYQLLKKNMLDDIYNK
ncbi:MAG: hypothetical protein IKT40_02665 [Bacilli bacterium]|nr:hypothetical protein [Bacilli bacterium]